jgi:antitoxin VapB
MTMAGRFDREPSHEKKDSRLFREFVVEKAMINLSQETEALAQRVALAKRVGVDDAIRGALEDTARAEGIALEPRRPRDQSAEAVAARHARIDEIVREVAALPVLDPRPTQALIDDLNEL